MDNWEHQYSKFFKIFMLFVIGAVAVLLVVTAYEDGTLVGALVQLAKFIAVIVCCSLVMKVLLMNWREDLERWQAKSRFNKLFYDLAWLGLVFLLMWYFFPPRNWEERIGDFVIAAVVAFANRRNEPLPPSLDDPITRSSDGFPLTTAH